MTGCRLGAGFQECSAIIWKAGSKQTFAAGQTAGDGGLEARKQGLKLQVWKVIETSAENVALSRPDTLAMRRFDSLLQETSLFLNIYFPICLDVTLTMALSWKCVKSVYVCKMQLNYINSSIYFYVFVKMVWDGDRNHKNPDETTIKYQISVNVMSPWDVYH